MSNVDRVVIKYQEAASEFDRMAQAANEMAQQTNQVKNVTSSVVGSGWVGRDAQAYSSTVERSTTKLNQQAEGMLQVVDKLRKQAEDSFQKELADAKRADSELGI